MGMARILELKKFSVGIGSMASLRNASFALATTHAGFGKAIK